MSRLKNGTNNTKRVLRPASFISLKYNEETWLDFIISSSVTTKKKLKKELSPMKVETVFHLVNFKMEVNWQRSPANNGSTYFHFHFWFYFLFRNVSSSVQIHNWEVCNREIFLLTFEKFFCSVERFVDAGR